MKNTLTICSIFCLFFLFFQNSKSIKAQPLVNIGIYAISPDTLDVRLKPDSAFDGLVSNLIFTVRWPVASNANLGLISEQITELLYIPMTKSGPEHDVGDWRYQLFFGTGLFTIVNAGATWTANQEFSLLKLAVENGLGEFEIVNDAVTDSLNGDFFVSLAALPKTGVIYQPTANLCPSFNLSNVPTEESCNPGGDGAIDLTVGAGTPPYTFIWTNAATTEDISNLIAGSYTVVVTDSFGCQDSATIVLSAEADNVDPVINCPADTTTCDTVVSYTVNASDNCIGEVLSQTSGVASGLAHPTGETVNTFQVTDGDGRTATCSFRVSVGATGDNVTPRINGSDGGFSGNVFKKDKLASSSVFIDDLNGDGFRDMVIGASDATRNDAIGKKQKKVGVIFVAFLDEDAAVISEQEISIENGNLGDIFDKGAQFGAALAYAGDLDSDGNGDIVVGAPGNATVIGGKNSKGAGSIQVIFLESDGTVKSSTRIDNENGYTGGGKKYGFGSSVASIDDLNSDGVTDLIVGIPGFDNAASGSKTKDAGGASVLFLNADGTLNAQQDINASDGNLPTDPIKKDKLGRSATLISPGRIALGSPGSTHVDGSGKKQAGAGSFRILDLATTGEVTAEIIVDGNDITGPVIKKDAMGFSMVGTGDIDDDGNNDLAVGVPGNDDGDKETGAILVFNLDGSGGIISEGKISATSGTFPGVLEKKDENASSLSILEESCFTLLGSGAVKDDNIDKDVGNQWLMALPAALSPDPAKNSPLAQFDDEILEMIEEQDASETLKDIFTKTSLLVFPNPFSTETNILFSNPENEDYELLVRDMAGKVVVHRTGVNSNQVVLKAGDLISGMYLIELRGENVFREKIMVE